MLLIVSNGAVIHVKSGHGVDPYFDISMSRSMKGWWKKWFYIRNGASVPLPAFTGSRPICFSSCGVGCAPPVNFFQLPDLIALAVKNQDVLVSRAMLPQPPHL
jgi:hypothetical protein